MTASPLFAVASDLHMDFAAMNPEFFDWRGDVLLLAGDLAEDDNLRKMHDFWDRVADMAKEVYVIAGNHEFYRSELDRVHDHLREYLTKYPNIKVLENDHVVTHGVVLFGATFWTDFDGLNPISMWDAGQRMNDFRQIRLAKAGFRKVTPAMVAMEHRTSLDNLKSILDTVGPDVPVVVMTHHGPSFQSIAKHYVGDQLNGAYVTNLDDFIHDHPQIKAWVHGHVHTFKNYKIGKCNVMVNARGYPGERDEDQFGPYEVLPFRIGE